MALALAATYPDLVEGVALMSSGARIQGDATPQEAAAAREWRQAFADRWGTEDSSLFERTGFELTRVVPTGGGVQVVEARAVG